MIVPFFFSDSHLSLARVAGSSGEETYDPKIPASQQIVTYQTKDGTIKKVTKAELQEQMETREKLMNELNETWEDKLHRTQEVQKERERALEELGITVEKNLVGVHTPKKVSFFVEFPSRSFDYGHKMPHLVNLVCPFFLFTLRFDGWDVYRMKVCVFWFPLPFCLHYQTRSAHE